jgi:hypothetical protein
MSRPITELSQLLATLSPALHPGAYVYCCVPYGQDVAGLEPVVTVREAQGCTVVVKEGHAVDAGLSILYRAAWITLTVHSDLEAVGLTAAVAAALTAEAISCNVVAGAHHDHLFVPWDRAEDALAALRRLQQASVGG